MGDHFVSRLGPANGEPFAAIDDPDTEPPRERPPAETPIDDLHFVALDCETTGQTPHHLVELGAVAFTLHSHLMSFETLVHTNDHINPYARRIHGIAPETLHGAPPVSRVVGRFRKFVQGTVLVEHSADAFDTRLIARTVGTDLDADNLDTTRLAARLWGLRDTIGLERLCEKLGVVHRKPHHALADAEATAACFIRLVAIGREDLGWETLGDLLDAGQPPPLRPADSTRPEARGRRRSTRSRSRRRSRPPASPA